MPKPIWTQVLFKSQEVKIKILHKTFLFLFLDLSHAVGISVRQFASDTEVVRFDSREKYLYDV